ncbi:amidase family protein [Mycobacterium kansasii]|uniref:Amidase family protein n=1 Tax=Mycobacterium kansasii TaxID=1768 RepID=A0A1V3WV85_MYCKA|nr:amidase family protein [Mycobacterium kansasii]
MMAQVVSTLEGIGWPVVEVTLPALDRMVDVFATMRGVETAIAHAETYPARADEYGPVLRGLLDNARKLSAVEYQGLITRRQECTEALQRVFTDVDLVLLPSAGLASPTVAGMRMLGVDSVLSAALAGPTAPLNVTGNPAICLPAGVTSRGTPLGCSSSAVISPSSSWSNAGMRFSRPPGSTGAGRSCESDAGRY